MIDTVLKITKKGLVELQGEDADATIKEILGKDGNKDDAAYIFFHRKTGRAAYICCQASEIKPLTFPDPKDYGTTSPQLFAMAVTYSTTMARLLLKRLKTPVTWLGQLKKGAAIILPIVIIAVLIFIVAVMTRGGD